MTLNKMMIIGNLGADPELRYTPSGKAVANLRVAVNDRSRGPDGEWVEETMWIGVEVWEQQAERLAEQLRKGNKIYAEGELNPQWSKNVKAVLIEVESGLSLADMATVDNSASGW